MACAQKSILGWLSWPSGHNEVHEHLVWKDKVPHGDVLWCDISKATLNHFCDVVGNAFEPLYEDLKTGMHGNTAVYGDETGGM